VSAGPGNRRGPHKGRRLSQRSWKAPETEPDPDSLPPCCAAFVPPQRVCSSRGGIATDPDISPEEFLGLGILSAFYTKAGQLKQRIGEIRIRVEHLLKVICRTGSIAPPLRDVAEIEQAETAVRIETQTVLEILLRRIETSRYVWEDRDMRTPASTAGL